MPILSQAYVMAQGSSPGSIYAAFRDLINTGFDRQVLPSAGNLILPYKTGVYILDAVGFELYVFDGEDAVSFGQFGNFLLTQVKPGASVISKLRNVRNVAKDLELVEQDTILVPQKIQNFLGVPGTVDVWRHKATGTKFALEVPFPYPTHQWYGVVGDLADD